MIGAEPRSDWLPPAIARDEHGFIRNGSVKRVASAVGEGSVAATQMNQYLAE